MAYTTLKKARVFDAEYLYRHKNGEDILCRVKAVRIGESLQKRRLIVTYENITEQKRTQNILRQRTEELEQKTKNLEEANIALNVILKKRETDKSTIEEGVVHNIRELIMPCIQQMKRGRMADEALKYLSLVESYLMNIASPFLLKLSLEHLNLTPKEVLVASLLKDGKSSKEIADLLNITVRGVDFHRNKIRRKLGLSNKKENLRSYLISCYSNESEPQEMTDRRNPAFTMYDILR
jgi:DNA-binding CsgD family transcriptional regulator